MKNLKNIFIDNYLIEIKSSEFRIEDYFIDSNVKIFNINASNQVRDEESLMINLYENCEFGEHFGKNWDALLDCLTEYDDSNFKTYIFIFHNFSSFQSKDEDSANLFEKVFYFSIERLFEADDDTEMNLLLLT